MFVLKKNPKHRSSEWLLIVQTACTFIPRGAVWPDVFPNIVHTYVLLWLLVIWLLYHIYCPQAPERLMPFAPISQISDTLHHLVISLLWNTIPAHHWGKFWVAVFCCSVLFPFSSLALFLCNLKTLFSVMFVFFSLYLFLCVYIISFWFVVTSLPPTFNVLVLFFTLKKDFVRPATCCICRWSYCLCHLTFILAVQAVDPLPLLGICLYWWNLLFVIFVFLVRAFSFLFKEVPSTFLLNPV